MTYFHWRLRFDEFVRLFREQRAPLFDRAGNPVSGSAMAAIFWSGYNGGPEPSRTMPQHDAWNAGRWCREHLLHGS